MTSIYKVTIMIPNPNVYQSGFIEDEGSAKYFEKAEDVKKYVNKTAKKIFDTNPEYEWARKEDPNANPGDYVPILVRKVHPSEAKKVE